MILAHSNVHLTLDTSPSFAAHAFEPTNLIPARGAVQARIRRAVVDVDLTRDASVTLATVADERVIQIDATVSADRAARITETVVQRSLALESHKAGSALAGEPFQLIHAGSSVLAGLRRAIVDRMLTLLACVPWFTGTSVPVYLVDALAVVLARFASALVNVRLAGSSSPSRMTDALVAEQIVHAYPVQTRIPRAQVYLLVAPFARESRRAVAVEVSH